MLERDAAVGGMGKTITVGPYAVDYGPHTFHIRDTEESRAIHEAIQPFFGPDPLILTRGTRVLLRGKEYVYPLEMMQVLTGVSPFLSARIIFDYAMATMKSTLAPPKHEDSFEEWGVRNLGRTLYDLCFGIYSARVWGLPTSQISSKQAQRVAKLNLKNVILRTLGDQGGSGDLLHEVHVSARGHQRAVREHGRGVTRRNGGCVKLESPAIRLERDGDRIARVVYSQNGREETIACSGVLSTLPLPQLVGMMTPALPPSVAEHAAKLRYRSLKLIYIALKRPQLTDYHWVYLLDGHFRVNRMSEQKNVSGDMVPPDRTMLCIELSLWKDEPLWTRVDEEIFRIALADLVKMDYGVTEAEVEDYYVTDIATAYPVYELNFEDHLIPVLEGVHAVPEPADARPARPVSQQQHGRQRAARHEGRPTTSPRRDFDSRAWLSEMLAFMNLRFEGK